MSGRDAPDSMHFELFQMIRAPRAGCTDWSMQLRWLDVVLR